MNLTTRYCGLSLPHPFMPGASPMASDLDTACRLRDAGAAAIVMPSLFEEQVIDESLFMETTLAVHHEAFSEALTYMPFPDEFRLGPHEYLEQIQRLKRATGLPVIGSLNGTTPGGWVRYATLMEQAGADVIEVNAYTVPTHVAGTAQMLEEQLAGVVASVVGCVAVPVAVKLSPYHSVLPNLAQRLAEAGASALVLFNRLFQPDIDTERLEPVSVYHSDPADLTLRLRWLSILDAKVPRLHYAASGGVHAPLHAVKALMCGADAVQVVTRLLRDGPGALTELIDGLRRWLVEHDYESLDQLRGSMNLHRCPNPGIFTRAHYIRQLQEYV